MLCWSRTSEMLTRTRFSRPAVLNKLPPYSGTRLSTRVTLAPKSSRRRARFEPMKPRPPVMRTRLFAKEFCSISAGLHRFDRFHEKRIGLDDCAAWQGVKMEVRPARDLASSCRLLDRISKTNYEHQLGERVTVVHPVM